MWQEYIPKVAEPAASFNPHLELDPRGMTPPKKISLPPSSLPQKISLPPPPRKIAYLLKSNPCPWKIAHPPLALSNSVISALLNPY